VIQQFVNLDMNVRKHLIFRRVSAQKGMCIAQLRTKHCAFKLRNRSSYCMILPAIEVRDLDF